ncbi:dTDP-4-dehydrorhamnose 3,5-epimerase [Thalassospira marina]|uniref:dTDP-4-dehydrorhamnose 3,5-epimerase n=1 Tax=Thalassospira marina TaxID=2048283 RepID=A0ABM6QDK3_9PROT|nr:dTDP-4-dehydrorhamnose 3,5-epimerase [Thalassospira marina]AUG54576.1 dTDP-4-dehydrorhamnose 3,5-epimerase [Thalassospira marina]
MNRFTATSLSLAGLYLIQRQKLGDSRGFLTRLFCVEELRTVGWINSIAQLNHTLTIKRGTLRGLHFQHPPHGEMKLVSCLRGEVWDVAVDLRKGSPTFLQWHAEILSEENNRAMLIPRGFAHGFQTLSDNVEMLYCHTEAYRASFEGGVNFHDKKLEISWPLEVTELSPRDQNLPMLEDRFEGLVI